MVCILKFSKGLNYVNSVGGDMVLVLFTSSDSVLYLYQVLSKYLTGFRVRDLNIRVDARVVTNVDGWTDRWTDKQTENWIPISRHA